MKKMQSVNEMKHKLIDMASAEVTKGIGSAAEMQALGEVVDMIKDLAEAEKACMEAAYYEGMMDDGEGEGKMGYDAWRYASGRFAPKGRGSRMGYDAPDGRMMPHPSMDAMGYDDGRRGGSDGRSGGRMGYPGAVYGYHEPKETMDDAIEGVREVWKDADKDARKKMRTVVEDLLYQMEQNEG